MSWLLGALAALLLLDAFRARGRVAGLAVLRAPRADAPGASGVHFEVSAAAGVHVPDAVAEAAAEHARAEQLEVLDLIPADLPTASALGLVLMVDPATYRSSRFENGRTAGHATLLADRVAQASPPAATGRAGWVAWAVRLKRYASQTSDLAVAPGLRAAPEAASERYAVLEGMLDIATVPVLVIQAAVLALLALAAIMWPIAGGALLAAYHLQPPIALAGQPLRPPDLWLRSLLRWPLEAWTLLETVLRRAPTPPEADPVERRRALYAELLSAGTGRFFEPPRVDCPLCGAGALKRVLETSDLAQCKPGRFRLDACGGCGHVFQNPRLSSEGLDFYYRDFYDGLQEAVTEATFSVRSERYHTRARALPASEAPREWLDVGAGHGHFCAAAREVWPDVRFDGLDLSESIDDARRRGWVSRALCGLFVDLAPELEGSYDVVSMGHYLEHTVAPRAELAAAWSALREGGHLLVEVPDPESRMRLVLGRLWIPWFQPQHLHFLSVANMARLLDAAGFAPVVWERGAMHQPADLTYAVLLAGRALVGMRRAPWLPRRGAWWAVAYAAVWSILGPLTAVAFLLDLALAPAMRRAGWSNTYLVVARKMKRRNSPSPD